MSSIPHAVDVYMTYVSAWGVLADMRHSVHVRKTYDFTHVAKPDDIQTTLCCVAKTDGVYRTLGSVAKPDGIRTTHCARS